VTTQLIYTAADAQPVGRIHQQIDREISMAAPPRWQLVASLALVITIGACGKKEEPAAPPAAQTPPAEVAPQPTEAVPATAATPAPIEAPTVTDEKAAAIQAALAEEEIVSDPRGQWAVSALASSTYGGDKAPESKTAYSPFMATGAPNVERFGDNGNSWASETADKGIEWLELKFAKPVHATELRIRQSYYPGAIIKLELIDDSGARHAVWQGVDSQQYVPNTIAWFKTSIETTPYVVTGARITLATNAVPGWNEIDAVQLLGD
jgi:predicted small lipoprotein YifL